MVFWNMTKIKSWIIAIASLAQDLTFESFQALILVAVLSIVANFVIICWSFTDFNSKLQFALKTDYYYAAKLLRISEFV